MVQATILTSWACPCCGVWLGVGSANGGEVLGAESAGRYIMQFAEALPPVGHVMLYARSTSIHCALHL